jgi:hypothetical protein
VGRRPRLVLRRPRRSYGARSSRPREFGFCDTLVLLCWLRQCGVSTVRGFMLAVHSASRPRDVGLLRRPPSNCTRTTTHTAPPTLQLRSGRHSPRNGDAPTALGPPLTSGCNPSDCFRAVTHIAVQRFRLRSSRHSGRNANAPTALGLPLGSERQRFNCVRTVTRQGSPRVLHHGGSATAPPTPPAPPPLDAQLQRRLRRCPPRLHSD